MQWTAPFMCSKSAVLDQAVSIHFNTHTELPDEGYGTGTPAVSGPSG